MNIAASARPAPLDVTAAASGSGTAASSGSATTTSANELIVGANTVKQHNTAAGSGFTQRILTSPNGDLAEDQIVTTAGSYAATATLSGGAWVMQMATFSAASSSGDTTPPTAPSNLTATAASASQINLAWTASTDNVGVTGYLVERCSGAGCSNFAQIGTPTSTSFSDTGLTASTSYSYRVRATDAAGNLSAYSNTATATTSPGQDTTPPTAPSNLTATAASASQINLAWTASTDNVGVTGYLVERCSGAGCSNFAQIGTPPSTSFSDTGLTASTSYSYRVRATDAAGNLSAYSNTATATTTGTTGGTIKFIQGTYQTPQSPSTSVAVTYTAAQSAGDLNVVAVGWNDTTSTVSSITDTSGNTYVLAVGPTVGTALTQSIYYAKNIAAAAAGANTVTVRFSAAAAFPDVRILEYSGLNPTSPLDVTAAAAGSGSPSNSGSATTTSANELIFGANVVQHTTTGAGSGFTSRIITSNKDIAEDQIVTSTGTYSATAPITAGAWVMQMATFSAASSSGDTTPPTAPSNLTATAASASQINLAWTASTDNVGVTGYLVERCSGAGCSNFAQIGTPTSTSFSDTGLTASTSYSYRVRATDAAGNLSAYSNTATATTSPGQDTTPPTAPSNLTATAASASQINLAWTASTDNVGVTSYLVERCSGAGCSNFAQIGTPPSTSFSDTGLTASTSYSYRVRATDAAGNLSAYSNTATATTSPGQDTTPPTAPSNLTATAASASQINLSWTASTDNVGVTGYLVERCSGAGCSNFAQIGTPPSTSFSDTGLTASTSYSYRVRATDAAGNLSAYSNTATATTTGTTGGTIKFIQGTYQTPQSPSTSVAVTYTAAQSAGDLNVVAVGWNDTTSTVSSITDTSGNTYVLAVGPTVGTALTQSIYYAKNIAAAAAGANTVTVRFSAAAAFPDVRILEYSGLNPTSPLDVTAAAAGSGSPSNSGSATTTSANELIFGANVVQHTTTGAGSGFTSRIITSDKDIAEDQIVTSTGTYSATAPITAGAWVMQMAGFRAP